MVRRLRVRCCHCRKWLLISAGQAGKTLCCPNPDCGESFPVPAPDEGSSESESQPASALPSRPISQMPVGAATLVRGQKFKLWVSLAVVLLVAVGLAVLLFLSPTGESKLGYAITGTITGLLLLMPLAVWLQMRRVTTRLDRFRKGDYIAHWNYSAEEWQAFDPDWKPGDPIDETYIGARAAYCGGRFVEWNVWSFALDAVFFHEGPPPILQIAILVQDANAGMHQDFLNIPVPELKQDEAPHVVRTLSQVQKQGAWKRTISFSVVVSLSILAIIVSLLAFFAM